MPIAAKKKIRKVVEGHKQVYQVIKHGTIDEGIARVVSYLNSFTSVVTYYSCQGEDRQGAEPYVLFTAYNRLDLARILDATRHIAKCEVEWFRGTLRYKLVFRGVFALAKFTERLNGYK